MILQKLIRGALIDENFARKRPAGHEFAGIMLTPLILIRAQIVGERLLTPRTLHGRHNRAETVRAGGCPGA